jgi:hypothetical protein
VSIRLLNCQTRNPSRSCISRSTSQSHSLSDSISQRASLFTYHLVRAGYSPVPSSRFTLTTPKTLVSSPTDYASSGSGSEHRTVTYAELATGQIPLKSSRTCHRHVTGGPPPGGPPPPVLPPPVAAIVNVLLPPACPDMSSSESVLSSTSISIPQLSASCCCSGVRLSQSCICAV